MPEPLPESTAGLQASLHTIAQMLREPHPLPPEARRALADLVDHLGSSLEVTGVPPAEVRHLAESTAHFVQALREHPDPARLASARDRLEQALFAAEASVPGASTFARQVLEALANIGI